MSIKRTIKKFHLLFIFIATGILFKCGNPYNPFNDPANAKVYLTTCSFFDRDSISLYEAGTFEIMVAAREEVDSFKLEAPFNRFYEDTMVRAAGNNGLPSQGPYQFEISFYDTGFQTVTLTTYRSNGEEVPQQFSFKVYQPLEPEDVKGFFGDTVLLKTKGVPDEGIIYHWNFSGHLTVSPYTNIASIHLPLFASKSGTGALWVSNLSGACASPAVPFSYTLTDTSKPDIDCINKGISNDTIYSADTFFQFKAFITDAEGAEVESCSVNGIAFDHVDRSRHIYVKRYTNLPELTRDSAMRLVVFAIDNQQFNNEASDTFHVLFDPEGAVTEDVSLTFTHPIEEVTRTSRHTFQILGEAQHARGETMELFCTVNGKTVPGFITAFGDKQWSWNLDLDSSYSKVTVTAKNTNGSILASSERVIIFDSTITDSIPPMIWEVSTGGQYIGSQYTTAFDDITLKIIAFDDGSGLKDLFIRYGVGQTVTGIDTLKVDSTKYIWPWTSNQLLHDNTGNFITIIAIDHMNNRTERSFTVYRNNKPVILNFNGYIDGIPEPSCMDEGYTVQLTIKDDDGDGFDVMPFKLPEGMTVSGTGLLKWQPVERPTTYRDTLIIDIVDAYSGANRYTWYLTRINCSKAEKEMSFITSESDIPGVLQAGKDILDVSLTVNRKDDAATPIFNARFIDNGSTLLDNGNILLDSSIAGTLKWAPNLTDTGYFKLLITVGDEFVNYDTLITTIHVVPMNNNICTLEYTFTGDTTFNGGLDLFSYAKPETLFFDIKDIDHPLTESYHVTTSLGSLHSVEQLKEKSFYIAIASNSTKKTDTLVVAIRDTANNSDMVQFVIFYQKPGDNILPKFASSPEFPSYFCISKPFSDTLRLTDQNDDIVKVIKVYAPDNLIISEDGIIEWTPDINSAGEDSLVIRLTDQIDTTDIFSWNLYSVDCTDLPPPVRFKTVTDDFPDQMQAVNDNISIKLELQPETGTAPYTFTAQIDNGKSIGNINSEGFLSWIPRDDDTGSCTLEIVVTDRLQTSDTLHPQITILPQNHHPVSLEYTYSGLQLPSGALVKGFPELPETTYFNIIDEDHPLTEGYRIITETSQTQSDTIHLSGDERDFKLLLEDKSDVNRSIDTFTVTVTDSTGTSYTTELITRSPLESPDEIADLSIAFTATQSSIVLSFPSYWNSVQRWYMDTDNTTSVFQMDQNRQPKTTYSSSTGKMALYFDHLTDNGDDVLSTTNSDNWAEAPFTIFIVFVLNTLQTEGRQTLMSTNTAEGFGLGITCDQHIGIINDVEQTVCDTSEWDGTDLEVEAGKWYVVTYQSNLGIDINGKIQAKAWLNGKAGSTTMTLSTQADPGIALGSGSTKTTGHYNGSLDGWLASIQHYDRPLSEDERIMMERYLSREYGIELEE